MTNDRIKREKAFLGAAIGAVANIATGLIGAAAARRKAKQMRIQQNRDATYNQAQNLTNAYSDQDYVDDLQNRITFKNGGKLKSKGDRIYRDKLFRCGGRKKAENGIEIKDTEQKNNTIDINEGIDSGISSAGNITSAIIGSNSNSTTINKTPFSVTKKNAVQNNDYTNNPFNTTPPQYLYKMVGYKGRHKRK